MRIKIAVAISLLLCSAVLVGAFIFVLPRAPHNVAAATTPINLLQSGWDYIPGVNAQPDGLHVSYLGNVLVAEDGSPGQLNPPVNLYGTRLATKGDFSISARVKDIVGGAALQFYGDTPIVKDEFRVIPRSLELRIDGPRITVSTWGEYSGKDLYDQKPISSKSYEFKSRPTNDITLHIQGNELGISMGNTQLTSMPNDIFKTSAVWFGMTAQNAGDTWTLAGLQAEPVLDGSVSVVNTQMTEPYSLAANGLQVSADKKRPGFLVGAAMPVAPTIADYKYASIALGGNFGSVTTENALKWQSIHPQPDTYDFHEADALVALVQKNALTVHGHTLVFGQANPEWVQHLPLDRAKQVMTDHIKQTVNHFRGRVASWDVVNEPLANEASVDSPLRENIWFKGMGQDYIATAFREAHAADPDAKLYINDYGIEEDGARWDALYALVFKLKLDGVPLDGVGFQAHVYERGDEINTTTLRKHIRKLAKLGLSSRISEMDVHSDDGAAAQARQYADVFAVCFSEPSCVSWTTWGITDAYDLYQDDSNHLGQGQDFLWDKDYKPTPAVTEIRKIITQ